MTEPFVGEICQVGFDYVPRGWAACDGSLLQIRNFNVLYAIIGTQFGGDGKTTFALPDLNGRFVVGAGRGPGLDNYVQGEKGGSARVTLTSSQMPPHAHVPQASAAPGDREGPGGATWAKPHYGRGSQAAYTKDGATGTMAQASVEATGGDQPHDNMPPFLATNFIIALVGVFPQRP